ncbi:MAG: hypothetical protein Q8O24_08355 [Gallionellaceae bacterium]|nr:hypothetical protein [Gallionellaceae bacterium]
MHWLTNKNKNLNKINMLHVIAVLSLAAVISPAFAEEALPSVTPYRPTVSNQAALSAPGWAEVETGWVTSQANDGSNRGSLPYLVKFAFTDRMGLLLGGEGYVSQRDAAGDQLNGSGDTMLLLKHKLGVSEDGNSAFGLEYGLSSPTASSGLNSGSGMKDHLMNGIYSTNVAGHSIDLNLNLTTLGTAVAGESRQQWGWATSVSRVLNDRWSVSAELSGTARQGTKPSDQLLVAASYEMSRRVVWDAGLAAGLNDTAAKWSVFAGVSILVGKIY